MIVDSSALVAVILGEPGHERLLDALGVHDAGVSAATLAETGIVLAARLGIAGRTLLARFVEESGMEVVPFSDRHWGVAAEAFLRFGKGRHPARLNFGDCLTYATARLAGEPLLCVGDDFSRTDLELVAI